MRGASDCQGDIAGKGRNKFKELVCITKALIQVDPAMQQVGRDTAVKKCRGDRKITDVSFCEVRKDRNHQVTGYVGFGIKEGAGK